MSGGQPLLHAASGPGPRVNARGQHNSTARVAFFDQQLRMSAAACFEDFGSVVGHVLYPFAIPDSGGGRGCPLLAHPKMARRLKAVSTHPVPGRAAGGRADLGVYGGFSGNRAAPGSIDAAPVASYLPFRLFFLPYKKSGPISLIGPPLWNPQRPPKTRAYSCPDGRRLRDFSIYVKVPVAIPNAWRSRGSEQLPPPLPGRPRQRQP